MNISSGPKRGLKAWLTSFDTNSWRYRIATFWLSDCEAKRIRECHMCTFYGFYIPLGIFRVMVLAVILTVAYLIVVPIGFVCGFTVTDIDDRGTPNEREQLFYPYKYSPTKGTYKRFAPWQWLLPLALVVGVALAIRYGLPQMVWSWGVAFVASHQIPVAVGVGFATITWVVLTLNRRLDLGHKLSQKCPTMEIVEVPEPEAVEPQRA